MCVMCGIEVVEVVRDGNMSEVTLTDGSTQVKNKAVVNWDNADSDPETFDYWCAMALAEMPGFLFV